MMEGYEPWWAQLEVGHKLRPKKVLRGYCTLTPEEEYTITRIVFDGYVFLKDKDGNNCGEWYMSSFERAERMRKD